jgi:IS5 family transposase
MRSNKIHNADLFTQAANDHFQKHVKTQSKQALAIIKEKIDWQALLKPLETKIAKTKVDNSPSGKKPFELLVIVRCFLLQKMYGLSDPRLEEEIADRRSFQIFLELTSHDSIPDETTICRYRELFARLALDKLLFASFSKQLEGLNLIVGKGTIVDATIKQAQATAGSGRDHDAEFTKSGGKTRYGYKGHIGVDADSTIIHSVEFTPANVHDSTMFNELITEQETIIYADKGYAKKQRTRALRNKGIRSGILDKGYRNTPLTRKQQVRNKILSSIRNAVERPFAYMKEVLGYKRCRYYDLGRNRFEFMLCAVVYNIRRLITLTTG